MLLYESLDHTITYSKGLSHFPESISSIYVVFRLPKLAQVALEELHLFSEVGYISQKTYNYFFAMGLDKF